jgi:hypothetical protein
MLFFVQLCSTVFVTSDSTASAKHNAKRLSQGAFCMEQTTQLLPNSIASTNSCTANASSAVASLCGWP